MPFDKFGRRGEFDEWSRNIQDIMDEMLKRDFVHFTDAGHWRPACNIYETRDSFHICVELAGVDQRCIEVACEEGRHVLICGFRAQPRPRSHEGPLSVHAMEIDEGEFRCVIELAEPIDTDEMQTAFVEGYLWITAPRAKAE